MGKSLIIVESPAKAKTIKKYLGPDYIVKAPVSHVKDLPERRLGIDISNNFEPEYVTIKGKNKVLKELRDDPKKVEHVYLAPDPDREGEAIAWHIANELYNVSKEQIYRVMLHEITQKGITEALQRPSRIDDDKVSAQQARRLLDRLVGYKISPLLWKKVQRGLSAGRVQSVALRIICEREDAIQAFKPREYWTLDADATASDPPPFRARLQTIDGKKATVPTEADATRIITDLQDASYKVANVKKTTRRRHPAPPFTTSKLQQEAARKHRFSAKRTMRVAQQLYEGLAIGDAGEVGLITYMRTDSIRVAAASVQEAHQHIRACYGRDYAATQSRKHKKQKAAQEAHEAIRPTAVYRTPESVKPYLSAEQLSLYTLIWHRFLASQMSSAVFDHTTIDIEAKQYRFRATGAVMRFPGFTTLYEETAPEPSDKDADKGGQNRILPPVVVDQAINVTGLMPTQHFTQPPPCFTEASLVNELEKLGIGRPGTYAAILSTLRDRQYVEDQERKLTPTELGKTVNVLLVESFPDILEAQFTAQLEDKLDKIEEGQYQWVETLQSFYEPFAADLAEATQKRRDVKREVEKTDKICHKCQEPIVIRRGRFGRFLACSGFPACKNTRELATESTSNGTRTPPVEATCDRCQRPMAIKRGRYGEFLACTGYPECKSTRPVNIAMDCLEDDCNGHIAQRKSRRRRIFYGCTNYPRCTFSAWQRPVPKPCPQCQTPYLLEKRGSTKQGKPPVLQCPSQECKYSETIDETPETSSVA